MRNFGLFFILLAVSATFQTRPSMAFMQDYHTEIDSLLKKLLPVKVAREEGIIVHAPRSVTRQQVIDRLLQITEESSQSRSQVIEALIKALEEPPSKERSVVADRWTAAVYVLGELRATEAVDILVKNIDQTGENLIMSSLHYRPVANAIVKIGQPAIARLIEALSDEDPEIRREVASTLAKIGQPAVDKLEQALHYGSVKSKSGAALALAWIGGKEAKAAIERAIEVETDREVLSLFRIALSEMRRVWGK